MELVTAYEYGGGVIEGGKAVLDLVDRESTEVLEASPGVPPAPPAPCDKVVELLVRKLFYFVFLQDLQILKMSFR